MSGILVDCKKDVLLCRSAALSKESGFTRIRVRSYHFVGVKKVLSGVADLSMLNIVLSIVQMPLPFCHVRGFMKLFVVLFFLLHIKKVLHVL